MKVELLFSGLDVAMAAVEMASCLHAVPSTGEDVVPNDDRSAVFKHSSPKKNAIREWALGGDENANMVHPGSGDTGGAACGSQQRDQAGQDDDRCAGEGGPTGSEGLSGDRKPETTPVKSEEEPEVVSVPCHSGGGDQEAPKQEEDVSSVLVVVIPHP